jgi:DNA-binding response OmpR family regulator
MNHVIEYIALRRFRVLPRRRELLADEEPVKLGGWVFDLLTVSIETPGAIVIKDELLARVWPDRVVAETIVATYRISVERQSRHVDRAPVTSKLRDNVAGGTLGRIIEGCQILLHHAA